MDTLSQDSSCHILPLLTWLVGWFLVLSFFFVFLFKRLERASSKAQEIKLEAMELLSWSAVLRKGTKQRSNSEPARSVPFLVNNASFHQESCSYSAHSEWQYYITYNWRDVQGTQKCRRNIFSSLHVQSAGCSPREYLIWCSTTKLVFDWSADCTAQCWMYCNVLQIWWCLWE